MNFTLNSLSVSLIANSPLLLIPNNYHFSSFSSNKCNLKHFFSSYFSTYSRIQSKFTNSYFSYFLYPPIKVENDESECITNQTYDDNHQNIIDTVEYCIDSCSFSNCKSIGGSYKYTRGGAIRFVHENSTLIVYGSTFDNCYCTGDGGAIFACASEHASFKKETGLMTHQKMESFYSHYCCYSKCSAENVANVEEREFSGYGSAILVSSCFIELNFSATSECPDTTKVEHAYGAQFDMQTKDVKSCYVNASDGDSYCCAAIEYRDAESGFFRFQTVINQKGGFITSFTRLHKVVNIENCNFVDNTLQFIDKAPKCCLLYISFQSVHISNFIVVGTVIDQSIPKDKPICFAGKNDDSDLTITITIENCIIDETIGNEKYLSGVTQNANTITNDAKTHYLKQLYLGNCKGEVIPPPKDATMIFTQSSEFSFSKFFSDSDDFTKSTMFSETDDFTKSTVFSDSKKFTLSTMFPKSDGFSLSMAFTNSDSFVTDKFSSSIIFTKSELFSVLFTSLPEIIIPPEVPTLDGSDSNKKKSKTPIIAGTVGGVAGAAVIAGVVAFLVKKKLANNIELESADTANIGSSEVKTQNPLFDNKVQDDPFKNDFEGELDSLGTVL